MVILFPKKMFRFAVLILSIVACAHESMEKEIIFKDDSNNPKLSAVQSVQRISIQYSVGTRVKGDRVVSKWDEQHQWTKPHHFIKRQYYPEDGNGANITFVQITAKQDSIRSFSYVDDGGIGKKFICIIFEAFDVLFLEYSIEIYGI
ncbi:uncharacterized protein LOC129566537 [Sitodiplosis mosellana]|uniref:uncharacterized protein LOC129566537 n=1 Tax=Sitodiplosis mosellana TaxID=263140 RepID=UPI002444FE4B|nr:uncharacterized protein LOC129566537 [Sitodiplosis mosellana]